jgi:hypothetical protein
LKFKPRKKREEGNEMIINDHENKQVVDTETGDYMIWSLADRDYHEWYFIIRDKDDKPLFGSIVKENGIKEWPDAGGATLVQYILKRSWIPSGREEAPTDFLGDHTQIVRLEQFLRIYHHYFGIKTPDPRFEFIDDRTGRLGDRS